MTHVRTYLDLGPLVVRRTPELRPRPFYAARKLGYWKFWFEWGTFYGGWRGRP